MTESLQPRKVLVALNVDHHAELPAQAKSVSDFISVLTRDHGGSEAFEIDVQVGVNSAGESELDGDGTPYVGFVNTNGVETGQSDEILPFEDDDEEDYDYDDEEDEE
jgi:hypothetical protein